ncbi:MAG: hypothetical protein RBU37_09230 [Myxococcota bacterium]|jgi:hypothetical protein|nr:hypothetical protein [Myxococcota bacterium]
MRLFYRITFASLAALLLGVGSAALTIYLVGMNGGVRNAPWLSSLDAGATDADPYTRAAIALVAPNRQEAGGIRPSAQSTKNRQGRYSTSSTRDAESSCAVDTSERSRK